MHYSIGFVFLEVGLVGVLNGMDHGSEARLNRAAHSYYFNYAVAALERRDHARVELYCKLDPKLVLEIEKTIIQNVEQAKWALDTVNGIKIRARL